MIYGYARVSTKGQATNGNSIEDQWEQLAKNGCDEIVAEQYTGTTTDRPEFSKLVARMSKGDTLMVTKLDRLARSAREGLDVIEDLLAKGIAIRILNMGVFDDSPVGKVTRTVLLAFAEFERDMIVERTQAGRKIAMQRPDYQNGRPLKYDESRRLHAINMILAGSSYNAVARDTGISKSTLIRAMRRYRETGKA